MSKKDSLMNEGIAGLMAAPKRIKVQDTPQPLPEPQQLTTSKEIGKDKKTTFSYHIPSDIANKMKDIAWESRRKLGDIVAEAMSQYIERYNNSK